MMLSTFFHLDTSQVTETYRMGCKLSLYSMGFSKMERLPDVRHTSVSPAIKGLTD